MGGTHPQNTPASVGGSFPNRDDELQSSDDEFATFNPTNNRGTATSFGKSSGAVLIQAVVEMKKVLLESDIPGASPTGEEARQRGYLPTHRRERFWHPELVNPSSHRVSPHRLLMSFGSGPTLNSMHQNHDTISQTPTYFQVSWITTSPT